MRVSETIEIGAPPEEVFEWLLDRRLMARWCEALGRPASFANCLPAERGEMRAGYRAEVGAPMRTRVFSADTETTSATFEVTEYEPPRRYGTLSRHPHAETRELYELTTTSNGTRLRCERDIDYSGLAQTGMWIGSILRPSAGIGFGRWARKDFRESLERLRELIEAA